MKKRYSFLYILMLFCSVFGHSVSAQITMTDSCTALALANTLAGAGVTIIAPTLNCPGISNGTFVGVSTLGFLNGIVLSSGRVQSGPTIVGSNGPASGFASFSTATPGDPMLTALAGQPTFDACILEFDFRTSGDTVKFNYVFGSEEYTGYTCSSFNDVFGFFISGPGFGGPTNIALIPGTTIPVCINSVNCTAGPICVALVGPGAPYCSYYVNNTAGTTITYDGLTTTLQAIAAVNPCDTYHLKIGIADGTDHIFDSGVFLEAGSFSSTPISIVPQGLNSTDTTVGSQYCVRGCHPGQFIFNVGTPITDSLTIYFTLGGTAIPGYDYNASATDSVTIYAGSTSDTVFINPLSVSPPGGPRTVVLYLLAAHSCSGPTILDSAIITILDSFYVNILTADTSICEGQSVHIITWGDTSLSYTWSPPVFLSSTTVQSPIATPPNTMTYAVSAVLPGTGCTPSTDMITITVIHPLMLDIGPPIKKICKGVPLPLNVVVTPLGGSYAYSWSPATDLSNPAIASPIVTPSTVGDFIYSVTVTETTAGCTAATSFTLHVLPDDFTLLSPDSAMCFNGTVQIRANGDTEFSYHWVPGFPMNDPNILTPIATVNTSTIFTVTGSYPGCPDMVHTIDLSIQSPHVDILTRDTMFCVGDSIYLSVLVTPTDSPYTFVWSPTTYLVNPGVIAPIFTSTVVGDFPHSVTIQSGLGCTSSDVVMLSPRPSAKITATSNSALINFGDHVQLDAINLTGYPLIYWWKPDDGSLNNPNIKNPTATPGDSTNYIVYVMNEWGCRDSSNIIVRVNDEVNEGVPTAFTPNGDGRNDVFRLTHLRYQKLVEFDVYNRWGEVVYHNTADITAGWDGTFNGVKQDMGVYTYMVIIAKPSGEQKMYKGTVTLIR